MAETIAIALVNAGFVGATAAGVSAAFTYAAYAYAAYSMYDGQKQARRQRDAARASITDRLVTTRSSGDRRLGYHGRRVDLVLASRLCRRPSLVFLPGSTRPRQ